MDQTVETAAPRLPHVSSTDQDLSLQEGSLRTVGCQVIRAEKKTGTRRGGCTELGTLLQFLCRDVTLRATDPVDTAIAAGAAFFDMLGVFAEFETDLRCERQMEGIAVVRARGVCKDGEPTINPDEVRRLHEEGRLSPSAIARRMTIAILGMQVPDRS